MRSTTIISIALLNIFTATIEGSIVVRGNDCEFIQLESITSNTGCSSGTKFVLKVKITSQNISTILFSGSVKNPEAVLDRGRQGDPGVRGADEEVPNLRELHGHHHLRFVQGRGRLGQCRPFYSLKGEPVVRVPYPA